MDAFFKGVNKLKSQSSTPILDALVECCDKETIHFDVPGHKGGKGLAYFDTILREKGLRLDINSAKPVDLLNNPSGVIKQAQALAAETFNADHCFFMVGGTTAAVHAMIMSTCKPGEKIIVPRNSHESVIKGLVLSGAVPIYVQPGISKRLGITNGVSMADIKEAINRNRDARAVLLMNPTYYGATSNISEIVRLAHSRGMVVLVDEAHGTHFGFHKDMPMSAMDAGADMSAVSMHKTGGSLTQSSMLLVKNGIVDSRSVMTTVQLMMTTSSSYLLLASLDAARKNLATMGDELVGRALELARDARNRINSIKGLYAFGGELINGDDIFGFDETKLGICVSGIGLSGFEVYDLLSEKYNIQVELADGSNILAIVSLGDTRSDIDALVAALEDIRASHSGGKRQIEQPILINPYVVISPREAFYSPKRTVRLEDAEGEVSGESLMLYPQGIPIFAIGERITRDMIDYIKFLKKHSAVLVGTEDPDIEHIKILGM